MKRFLCIIIFALLISSHYSYASLYIDSTDKDIQPIVNGSVAQLFKIELIPYKSYDLEALQKVVPTLATTLNVCTASSIEMSDDQTTNKFIELGKQALAVALMCYTKAQMRLYREIIPVKDVILLILALLEQEKEYDGIFNHIITNRVPGPIL